MVGVVAARDGVRVGARDGAGHPWLGVGPWPPSPCLWLQIIKVGIRPELHNSKALIPDKGYNLFWLQPWISIYTSG